MDEKAKKVLERLQAQCSKREYCTSDIRKKALEKMEGDREAADMIVDSLVSDKFVDDLRYATAFAREKASLTGWGPIKIKMALAAKGINVDTASQAMLEIDGDKADAKLEKLLETRWRALEEDPQGKLKLLRFALSRGYSYDQVKDSVDTITRK